MAVTANITSCTISTINVTATTFGPLDLALITKLFNMGTSLGVPFFNIWIQTQSIVIPSELFGLFKLSDVVVKYHDNYLEAGLTPTFVPPSLPKLVPYVAPKTTGQVQFILGTDADGNVEIIEYME